MVYRFITVRFQVLTAAKMKFTVLWDVAPCSLIGVGRRFRGAYCLHHRPEDCNLRLVIVRSSLWNWWNQHLSLCSLWRAKVQCTSFVRISVLTKPAKTLLKAYDLWVINPTALGLFGRCPTTSHKGTYSFLTSALDGCEWLASRPGHTLPSGKDPRYPLYTRLGWPQSRSGHRG
jgi:hypothetical protein